MNSLLFLTLSALTPSASPGPLQTGENLVDRGEVKAGMPLAQAFTLRNRGESPIAIVDISGGCGCVKPSVSQRSLQPGETTELSVEINTLSQNAGPNVWKVAVRYQHGAEDRRITDDLELRVKAKLIREIDVEPVALFLAIDRETSHTITVTDRRANRRAKALNITEIRCASKQVKAQLSTAGTNAEGHSVQQIRVTVLDSCPPGYFAEPLILLTDDGEYRELRVPLMVTRRTPEQATAAPEQLDLRLAQGQAAASGMVRLRTPDEKPVAVERIEADHPAIRFKWVAGPGAMVTLRLGVDLKEARASGTGIVQVHLKEPKPQVIRIPVSWQVP